jgi:hypothetical protein
MRALFYLAGIACLAAWGISVFVYSGTDLIHSLLAFGIIFFVMAIIGNDQPVQVEPQSNNMIAS